LRYWRGYWGGEQCLAQSKRRGHGRVCRPGSQDIRRAGIVGGIVKDGKLVFAKGYGVRKLGEAASVDENTLFPIGSNTKAFTSALLASLVDAGSFRGTTRCTSASWISDVRPVCVA